MIIPEICIFCNDLLTSQEIDGMSLNHCKEMYQDKKHEDKMFWFYLEGSTLLSCNIAITPYCISWDFTKNKTTLNFEGIKIITLESIIDFENFNEKYIIEKIKFLLTFS